MTARRPDAAARAWARVAARLAALALATTSLAACGGSPSPPRAATPTAAGTATATATPRAAVPALCRPLRVRTLGTVTAPGATELSGLARTPDGTFWTHNDSGDVPRLFQLDGRGRLLAEVHVSGAQAVDWEDIAADGRTLYVGDIGDNEAKRPNVVVYRIDGTAATPIPLTYADGPHDAETLLVDRGRIVVVTKDFSGTAGVYVAHDGHLRRRATLRLGVGQALTAGDVAPHVIVLRSYDRAFVFARRRDESIVSTLERAPCTAGADLIREGQGESLALRRDGHAFYTLPEGRRPRLRRYEDAG
ncbi:MAG TPA: hypothetical protein VNS09_12260 [Solirubrobacter sp.]|nr:hypothetical protein [Solirubrobacter sp.]